MQEDNGRGGAACTPTLDFIIVRTPDGPAGPCVSVLLPIASSDPFLARSILKYRITGILIYLLLSSMYICVSILTHITTTKSVFIRGKNGFKLAGNLRRRQQPKTSENRVRVLRMHHVSIFNCLSWYIFYKSAIIKLMVTNITLKLKLGKLYVDTRRVHESAESKLLW